MYTFAERDAAAVLELRDHRRRSLVVLLRPHSFRLFGREQARSRFGQSGGTAAFQWMRILLPLADSNSIRHSGVEAGAGAISSTNLGLRGARRLRPSAATRSRFSLPASRCSCWAVRFTPSWRAALIAADHNSSGIGDFLVRPLLQSSNCVRTASMPLPAPTFVPIVLSSYQPKDDSSNCGPIPSRTPTERTRPATRSLHTTPTAIHDKDRLPRCGRSR